MNWRQWWYGEPRNKPVEIPYASSVHELNAAIHESYRLARLALLAAEAEQEEVNARVAMLNDRIARLKARYGAAIAEEQHTN